MDKFTLKDIESVFNGAKLVYFSKDTIYIWYSKQWIKKYTLSLQYDRDLYIKNNLSTIKDVFDIIMEDIKSREKNLLLIPY